MLPNVLTKTSFVRKALNSPLSRKNLADACPICKGAVTGRCRCSIGSESCAHGHSWHRCQVHGVTVLGDGHNSAGGCSCPIDKNLIDSLTQDEISRLALEFLERQQWEWMDRLAGVGKSLPTPLRKTASVVRKGLLSPLVRKSGEHWVTIGGTKDGAGHRHGGHAVKIDADGKIVGGNVPKEWQGKPVSSAHKKEVDKPSASSTIVDTPAKETGGSKEDGKMTLSVPTEVPIMTGTPKQKNAAEKIRGEQLQEIARAAATTDRNISRMDKGEIAPDAEKRTAFEKQKSELSQRIATLAAITDAAWWLDNSRVDFASVETEKFAKLVGKGGPSEAKDIKKVDMASVNELPRRERPAARAKRIIEANPGISDLNLGREIFGYTHPGKKVDDAMCLAEVKVLRQDGGI